MTHTTSSLLFYFYGFGAHRDLHSFPTRRSSDLAAGDCGAARGRPELRPHRRRELVDGRHLHVHAWRLAAPDRQHVRSEEHTSELQSPYDLVCRLLLEKKKNSRKSASITEKPIHP